MRVLVLVALLAGGLRADIIEFENGDRLHGKVLSLGETELKLQNDVQGVLSLPRSKIVSIHFKGAPQPKTATGAVQPAPADVLKRLENPETSAKAVEQVQNQFLADATPEARQIYQEMVAGLLSGKLQLGDIRAQAQTTLKELRELEKDLGDNETAGLLDSYAAILENFLKNAPASTNAVEKPSGAAPETEEN